MEFVLYSLSNFPLINYFVCSSKKHKYQSAYKYVRDKLSEQMNIPRVYKTLLEGHHASHMQHLRILRDK